MKRFKTLIITGLLLLVAAWVFGAGQWSPLFTKKQPGGIYGVINTELTTGDIWYVDSGLGTDGAGYGRNPKSPMATLDYLIAYTTADNGDLVFVSPGHAENLSAVDGVDIDKAGLRIVGLGEGANRPTFTYTGTAGEFVIGAANVTVENIRFLAGISAVTMGISVEAAGDNFTLKNCEFPEPTTSSFEFLDFIDLVAGADGVRIIGCTAFSADETGAAHFVEAGNGVNNNLQLINNYVYGEFSVAAVWSNDIDLEVLIEGGTYANLTNGEHAIEFTGAATGMIKDVLVRTDVQTTAVDPGSMTMSNVFWDADATADSVALPVVLGTAGAGSIGSINLTTTDNLHGKIGTDTEMGDVSLYDQYIADQVDLDAILEDTITISGGTLPVGPVSGSLSTFISGGGTALGTPLATSKSLVDAIGTNGTTVADTATGLAGMIGVDDNDNTMATTNVAANADGSVFERLEQIDVDTSVIAADTPYIADLALPVAPTANSLAAFIASGGTGLGTELADSKSIVDALGTNGTTVADTISGIAGMIGVEDADNAMITAAVVPNADGSVFERLEGLAAAALPTYNHPNYIALSADMSSATWNTQAAHEILTVTGNIRLRVMAECTETLTDGADGATLSLGDEITVAGMIASTSAGGAGAANQLDAAEFWMDATPADVSPVAESSAILDFVVLQGADVGYTIGGEALTDGILIFHMWWYPLDSTGAAVVGEGGVL